MNNTALLAAAKIIATTALETMAAHAGCTVDAILAAIKADETGATARRYAALVEIGINAAGKIVAA